MIKYDWGLMVAPNMIVGLIYIINEIFFNNMIN